MVPSESTSPLERGRKKKGRGGGETYDVSRSKGEKECITK